MKLIIVFLFISVSYLSANELFAQNDHINLIAKEKTLESVLNELESQTSYLFFYNHNEINVNKKVTCTIIDSNILEVLEDILKGSDICYSLIKDYIVLTKGVSKKSYAPTTDIQPVKIIGTVTDSATGEGLPGVYVMIEGTNDGTVTDADGRYSIEKPYDGAVLLFSYVGYSSKRIVIEASSIIDVQLTQDIRALQEVVVVGYGTQSKISVTGAISALDVKALKQSPVANISNALSGRLPGLITIQSSGEPSADGASIWIRGIGTYQSAQGPLVLVDGVERGFNRLDPNEVENISILKDASATAVYGVRGANGVIIVTTKRGQEGKPQISFSLQQGIQTPTRLPEYLDSYDALTLYREGLINDGENSATYTDEYLLKYKDRSNPTYEYLYPNVNWTEELLKDYSTITKGNLNVSGGNKQAKYFVSIGYLNQNGLYNYEEAVEDYDLQVRSRRYNFRSNVDLQLLRNVKAEINLGGIVADINYPYQSASIMFAAIQNTPSWFYPLTNPNGSMAEVINLASNPYALLTQTGYSRHFNTNLQATSGLTWNMPFITKGLSVRVRMSFDTYNYRNVTRSKGYKSYTYSCDENETDFDNGDYSLVSDGTETLGYSVNSDGERSDLFEAFINYNRVFGNHDVGAMLMYNQSQFLDDADASIYGLPYRQQGFVMRTTYNYKSKYYFEFNAGYNGSENFYEGHRFGFFPAVSLSWVVSDEPFFRNNLSLISLFKLRASYGEVGNDDIGGNRFLYQSTWTTSTGGYNLGATRQGNSFGGATETATGNRNITWERARKTNIGFNLAVNNKIFELSGDYFYEYRDQILTDPQTIPDIIGISVLPKINAGIVKNQGFEIELAHHYNFSYLGYYVKANYSFARNKIMEMDEPSYEGHEWQAQTGNRIGEMYGYKAIGLFQSAEEINNAPVHTLATVQPGDIRYADMNNDGQITSADAGYLGKVANPESFFGIALGLNYKSFDVSVLFQGAAGGSTWWYGSAFWAFYAKNNVLADVKDHHWSSSNTDEENARAKWPRMVSNNNANNHQNSSYWIHSSDYIRLKNLEVGYNLPQLLLDRYNLKGIRIYANAMNLFTWDKMKILDPESPNGANSYPQQKVFNLGVNLTF